MCLLDTVKELCPRRDWDVVRRVLSGARDLTHENEKNDVGFFASPLRPVKTCLSSKANRFYKAEAEALVGLLVRKVFTGGSQLETELLVCTNSKPCRHFTWRSRQIRFLSEQVRRQ